MNINSLLIWHRFVGNIYTNAPSFICIMRFWTLPWRNSTVSVNIRGLRRRKPTISCAEQIKD